MQKVSTSLLLLILVVFCMSGRPGKKELWQDWDDVVKNVKETPKPILIDMYTDWCYYCKVMDATTYRNDSVNEFLKQNYYRFKFNAEGKDTIQWQNKSFAFSNRFGVNEFAVYLTRGNIVYPTTIIITPGGQPFYQHGELKVEELEMLLKYFADSQNQKIPLEQFAKNFKPRWKK